MPEIKSSENLKETKPLIKGIDPSQMNPIAKPEAMFVLPKRRGYSKYIIIPIILIAFLAAAWVVYGQYSKQASAPTVEIQQEVKEEVPVEVKSDTRYYLASPTEGKETKVYKYSDGTDTLVGKIDQGSLSVIGNYVRPYTYLVNFNFGKLQILDATTAKIEPLFDLKDPNIQIREVALSSDKKWLAYGRNFEGVDGKGWSGELWLYNIETKEQKQIGKQIELGLYQGFSILGWRNGDKELVVSALGGDAGAVWGDIYVANIETGKMDKIDPIEKKDKVGFITGILSPNHDKWLFEYCAQPDKAAIEKADGITGYTPCISGTELRTYDFGTKEIKTVYKNLRYDNNGDKNMLRTFMSKRWRDDKTIIAAVPGAILSIPVGNPDKTTELVTYDRSNPQKFADNFVSIVNADGKQIVYIKDETWYVFNYKSEKVTDLNPAVRKEFINSWLD